MPVTNLNLEWERFLAIIAKQRLHHANLLVAPQQSEVLDVIYRMVAAVLCMHENKPCQLCKACHLVQQRIHPDLTEVIPDKVGGSIKIEQIRDLHDLAFRSPQLSAKRVIVINPAEKMNNFAANALLKLLEEPPDSVYFFLLVEHIATLPATIISRCQQWRFCSVEGIAKDYLSMIDPRNTLIDQLPVIKQDLDNLTNNKLSLCSLVDKWSGYDYNSLIELLYLFNAQLISDKLTHKNQLPFSQRFHALQLFSQADQLNEIYKNLLQNNNINQRLTLENLLLGYKNDAL